MSDSFPPVASSTPPTRPLAPRLIAFVAVVAVIAVAALYARPPYQMTIATGPEGGSYYQAALGYQKILAARGISLRLQPNPNSLDIVRDVGEPRSGIDAGFIAQDVSGSKDADLFAIGQIELQPLFIFASADLGRRSTLDDLRGRKIVMPPTNSATSDAAMRLFKLYDITQQNSFFTFEGLADAVKDLRAGRFDAGVFMLAAENPVVRELAADSSLHLMHITEVKAIANHLPFLRPVVLPRGIYNIADSIPPNDTSMVAATVGVVVRRDLHPYLVYSLLEAMTKVHRDPTFLSGAGDYPTIVGSQLTVHPLAAQYYRTGMPWAYSELPPWPASAVYQDQLIIVGTFFLSGMIIAVRYLAELGSIVLETIALSILRSVERPAAGTAETSRLRLRLGNIAQRLLRMTLRRHRGDQPIAPGRPSADGTG
jgi:TRAP transporter TAXI family solute receptor